MSAFDRIPTARPDVELCRFSLDALDELVAAGNHAEISAYMGDGFPVPYTRASGASWIESTMQHEPPLEYAILVDGVVAGGAGAVGSTGETTGSWEVGWWVTPSQWGSGVATAAVAALVDEFFSRREVMRLHASTMDRNPASSRVAEKVGFVHEATLASAYLKRGVRYDQLLFGITRERWAANR